MEDLSVGVIIILKWIEKLGYRHGLAGRTLHTHTPQVQNYATKHDQAHDKISVNHYE